AGSPTPSIVAGLAPRALACDGRAVPAWVFGYGSLLFRPGFAHGRAELAELRGYARRFHQGSPDHRGTPERPGRVVTLVEDEGAVTTGLAFELDDRDAEAVLAALDVREQGGYARAEVEVRTSSGTVRATTWIARPGNPHWLGPAPFDAIAAHVLASSGPSGTNAEYVLRLDETLARLGSRDAHVAELAAHVRRAMRDAAADPVQDAR
ncbi:MAG TPA: gamma-glutamylcyclotransferase, partial [Minicystis sp.]|nr:gamma-glutamylcyclotransferase [Minicystis sp.]